MVIDYLFRVVHVAVTDLDGVSVEDFFSTETPSTSTEAPSRSVTETRQQDMQLPTSL